MFRMESMERQSFQESVHEAFQEIIVRSDVSSMKSQLEECERVIVSLSLRWGEDVAFGVEEEELFKNIRKIFPQNKQVIDEIQKKVFELIQSFRAQMVRMETKIRRNKIELYAINAKIGKINREREAEKKDFNDKIEKMNRDREAEKKEREAEKKEREAEKKKREAEKKDLTAKLEDQRNSALRRQIAINIEHMMKMEILMRLGDEDQQKFKNRQGHWETWIVSSTPVEKLFWKLSPENQSDVSTKFFGEGGFETFMRVMKCLKAFSHVEDGAHPTTLIDGCPVTSKIAIALVNDVEVHASIKIEVTEAKKQAKKFVEMLGKYRTDHKESNFLQNFP